MCILSEQWALSTMHTSNQFCLYNKIQNSHLPRIEFVWPTYQTLVKFLHMVWTLRNLGSQEKYQKKNSYEKTGAAMLTSFGGEERYAYKIFVSEHHSWFCVVTKNSMNCIIAIQKGDKILAINAIAAAWQHIDASWLWSGCC